jgi:hypothetical protein
MTMWYVPAADGCTRGQTYLTVHQMTGGGTATQRVGALVASEPVTSPVMLGGKVLIFGASGAIDITNLLPDSVTPGRAVPPESSVTSKFKQLAWWEVL